MNAGSDLVTMERSKVTILCILMLLAHSTLLAQNSAQLKQDSLRNALEKATNDTARVDLLNELAGAYKHTDAQRTGTYAGQALDLAKSIGYSKGECMALNLRGLAAYRLSEYPEAIGHLRAAADMAQEIGDSTVLNYANGNLGLVYMKLGDLPTALEYYQRQIAITEAQKDSLSLYRVFTNIGLLHRRGNNEALATSYLRQALAIAESLNDQASTATVLHNLATGLNNMGYPDSARTLYEQALAMNKVVGNDRFRATNHSALAMLFLEAGDPVLAKAHADTSIQIRSRLGNLAEQAMAHGVLSNILLATGEERAALKEMERSLELSTQVGDLENTLESMKALAMQLSGLGRDKDAVYWFERHVSLRDSLDKEEATEKLARMQVAHEVAQKDARIAALAEEERQQRALSELREQQRDRWMLAAIVLVLLVIFSIVQVLRIRRLNRALAIARDRAERNERSMDHFLSIMGHEVRSPMAASIASMNMARESSSGGDRDRYLDIAARSMQNLLRIVNDLLDRSAIEAGTLRIDRIAFSPMEVFQSAIRPFEALASSKGLTLITELDPAILGEYEGDPGRTGQIITNLLGNAVKYTDKGKITFSAKPTGSGGIVLRIADTGRGMSPEQRARMFTPFHRIDDKERSDPGGTGLGLYITAMLVRRMGGSIEVESIPGEGTVFTVVLPMPVRPIDLRTPKNNVKRIHHEGPLFYVVDDDPLERARSIELLHQLRPEATIVEAAHGDEFLAILENLDAAALKGAIVFTDLDMPHASGFDLVRRLKNGPHAHLPCVAVTSSVLMMDGSELMALGFAAALSKPLDEVELAGILKALTSGPKLYADLP